MARSTLRLISWNVAGWTRNVELQLVELQLEEIRSRQPDIVTLQEVRPSMLEQFRHGLEVMGLGHVEETVSQARQIARRDGVLVASRWPAQALTRIQTPHIEQTVSVGIESQWGPIDWRAKGREIGRRFDHIFAARSLNATACEYLQRARTRRFSDHAPIEATFAPQQSGA